MVATLTLACAVVVLKHHAVLDRAEWREHRPHIPLGQTLAQHAHIHLAALISCSIQTQTNHTKQQPELIVNAQNSQKFNTGYALAL